MASGKVNRDAGTGRFVTPQYARTNPRTTVQETVTKSKKGGSKK